MKSPPIELLAHAQLAQPVVSVLGAVVFQASASFWPQRPALEPAGGLER